MKKIIISLFLLVCPLLVSAAELSVQTQIGNIVLPTEKEINEQLDNLTKDARLSDEDKTKTELLYKLGLDRLSKIDDYESKQKELDNTLRYANRRLVNLSKDLGEEENRQSLNAQVIENYTEEQLNRAIEKTQQDLVTSQIELAAAGDNYNRIQTLPEKSHNIITTNNDKVKGFISSIDKNSSPDLFKNRITAILIYSANLETNYYKTQLQNLSTLQDLANYELKISNLKYARYEKNLKVLNYKKNLGNSNEYSLDELEKIKTDIPQLEKHITTITNIYSYVTEHKKKYATYQHDYQMVESAYNKVDQIEKDLNNQISEIGQNLVLSRLLNKQLSMVPKVKLPYDLDSVIANLNINIYEVREQLNKHMDIEKTVQNDIKLNRDLENYRKELISIYIQERHALNDIYQVLANELSTAISLKVKYNEYQKVAEKIRFDISEQLFWVKSNQKVGTKFLTESIPTIKYDFQNLLLKFSSKEFIKETSSTITYVILPFIVFSLFVLGFLKTIKRNNNKLARRLDRASDSIMLTPIAIINNIAMMIPQLCWKVVLGSIVICIALANTEMQRTVILIMVLHIFVFTFFIHIVRPNALVQRHFSVAPYKLTKYSDSLKRVWLFTLPLLIFANVAEADSTVIYSDVTSHAVILISFIALLFVFVKFFYNAVKDYQNSSFTTIIGFMIAIAISAISVIFVASGYLYSIVTLTNRTAYTCYIVLAYILVSQTIHRMMYVYINKAFEKKRQKYVAIQKKLNKAITGTAMHFSASHVCHKAFRLVNSVLLCITAFFLYSQWSDLASVLRYLDTVKIWSRTEFIGGAPVVTEYLSLANVLLAIFILVITSILNKNLPILLEKLFQIRKGVNTKSTGYTVKVISSYLITGVGIIIAAGVIGIHWKNLQWLVAALSVGLGFGLQEIFANFVSGLILLFERQIRVGDIITLNGLSGTVNEIRIRATTIRSFENKEVMIPNREFITSALTNWSLTDTVTKIEFVVRIGYSSDVEKAKTILRQIVNKCRYISKDKTSLIYVKELDASFVNIAVEVYVGNISDRKLTIDYLSRESLTQFAKSGIEIPFKQLDLNVKTLEKDEFIQKLKQGLFNKVESVPDGETK